MKNKIIKLFFIVVINFIIIFVLFVVLELFVYGMHYKNYLDNVIPVIEKFKYEIILKESVINREKETLARKLRKPSGIQYKRNAIVLFGCSFAYGDGLKEKETFAYKLSEILKTPVYNRALPKGNLQEMYYQVAAEGSKDFYKDIPAKEIDTCIYLMIDEHYTRMYTLYTINTWRQYLNYIDKKGKIKKEIQEPLYLSILKSSYIYRHLSSIFAYKYSINPKHSSEIVNRAVLYIVESKKEIEKVKNGKIHFIVVLYEKMPYEKEFIQKLKENGIKTIKTKTLTKENLKDLKYTISKTDRHPNETAWNLLTPLIAKKIQKNMQ